MKDEQRGGVSRATQAAEKKREYLAHVTEEAQPATPGPPQEGLPVGSGAGKMGARTETGSCLPREIAHPMVSFESVAPLLRWGVSRTWSV